MQREKKSSKTMQIGQNDNKILVNKGLRNINGKFVAAS